MCDVLCRAWGGRVTLGMLILTPPSSPNPGVGCCPAVGCIVGCLPPVVGPAAGASSDLHGSLKDDGVTGLFLSCPDRRAVDLTWG